MVWLKMEGFGDFGHLDYTLSENIALESELALKLHSYLLKVSKNNEVFRVLKTRRDFFGNFKNNAFRPRVNQHTKKCVHQ